MTIVLGLCAAISAGTSDFLGGFGSRRAPAIVVTTASHLAGFLVAVVLSTIITGSLSGADVAWGAVGGLGGAAGLLSIYTGYARARVSIVAPVAGVGAAALPVVVDAATGGEELSASAIAGVGVGLVAIALVSIGRSTHDAPLATSLLFGAGGAVGLGLLLLCLAQAADDGGLWPLAVARLAGFAVLAVVLVATTTDRTGGVLPRSSHGVMPYVLGIGVLGTGANALFIGAARSGSTSVAAVLTSMFPAVTVLWAFLVTGERLRTVQVIGLGVALISVSLIAVG